MKLFGNTGSGQRARQDVSEKAAPKEDEILQEIEKPEVDIPIDEAPTIPAPVEEEVLPEQVEEPTPNAPVVILPETEEEEEAEEEDAPEEQLQPSKSKFAAVERKSSAKEPAESGNRGLIKGIILLAFSIAVLCITVFSVFSYLLKDNTSSKPTPIKEPTTQPVIQTEVVPSTTDEEVVTVDLVAPESVTEGIYNLLIIGIDDNDKYTDTVMMLHVDANSHQLSALSLPHNTLVYGDYDVPMIDEVYHNSGNGEDGIKALSEKVESMFGFPMDANIVLTSESFTKLMKSFDTINFDVPETLPTGLKKGEQALGAEAALELLQTKKFSDDTIRRERVQLDFLQAFGVQKLSSLTPSEISILAKTFSEVLDSDLTEENFAFLLSEFQNCDFTNLKYYLMPGRIIKYYSRDYHQLDETAMLAILNMSFNPYDEDLDEDDVEIRTEKETDVPESDYIGEQNNDDDDDEDEDNGGGGGTYDPGTGSEQTPDSGDTNPDEP